MADITICVNKECPLSVSCYRHNAKPSEFQSVAKFEPIIDDELDEVECNMYLKPRPIRKEFK